jgi:hypothetical protein
MVNTKHDTHSYESTNCGEGSYMREIYDIEVLYDAFQQAKIGSDWKPQVQNFEMNLLTELCEIQKQLINRTFKFDKPNEFILSERGKTRVISGDNIKDRVVKRALCDEILIPSIKKYLTYDNGASLKGKGISFSRDRIEVHLRKFYMQNKSNDGYILLGDYTKYFDNIQHKILMDMFKSIIKNDLAIWLIEKVLEQAMVDVSFMDDYEYSNSLNVVFNSVDYDKIDKKLLTGEKFMGKRMNIGDQVAQVAGIFYPHRIDNYIKIVEGIKFYGRYMDDFYLIDKDKNRLEDILKNVNEIALKSGIYIHQNKTAIYKLSDYWRYLKLQYSLTSTGRIIKKIHPKRLTEMRRKLKKIVYILNENEFENYYNSWFLNHYKTMSKIQRKNINSLYYKLKEEVYAQNNFTKSN